MSRVLVVDDDADTRLLVRELLEEEGHEVTEAGSAAEALRRLEEDRPELLVLDLKLPDGSGAEVIRQLRAGPHRHIRVVVTTASNRPDVPADVRVLTKPFDVEALVEMARGAC